MDVETGENAWTCQGRQIPHNAIAIDGGKLFFVDTELTRDQRREAMAATLQQIQKLPEIEREAAEKMLGKAEIRRVTALDAQTGQVRWRKGVDLTHCGDGAVSAMVQNGVLLVFGVYTDGHYWKEFFAGQFAGRRVTALSAEDGRLLWSKPVGYRVRPIVIGDTLHAEPWTFDLQTGEPTMRVHPITGQPDRWQYARPGHHCGCPIGTPNCLFFRSWCLGYYDLLADSGTMHFGAQRPGCWINFIPAGGLLVVPESSAGCMCAFPNMCSVTFKPAEKNHAYSYYSAPGPLTPVKRLGINFAAAGDRKDSAGNLWLGYPRPTGSLVLQLKLDVSFFPGGSYVQSSSRYAQVTGSDEAWLFASAAAGLKRCVIPLLGRDDPPARYRVRLAFADPDNAEPGRRVFDVKLQGKLALADFDIVKESGGRNRAVVKKFSGVEVKDNLAIELAPKTPNPLPQRCRSSKPWKSLALRQPPAIGRLQAGLLDDRLAGLFCGRRVAEVVVAPGVPVLLALVEADQLGRGVVDHVLLEQEALAPFVDEHAVVRGPLGQRAAVDVVDVVAADHRARLEAQGVDAAAVAEPVHHVVDVVVLDEVLLAGRGLRVPLPADGDPRVGQAVDQVVRDRGAVGDAHPDAHRPVILDAAVVDVVVAHAFALRHPRLARGTADVDAVAADVEDVDCPG